MLTQSENKCFQIPSLKFSEKKEWTLAQTGETSEELASFHQNEFVFLL